MLGDLRTEKGTTIFVCTPYMDEAERCNWVGLLYQGQLIAHDSPQTVRKMVPGRLLEFTPSDFVPAWRSVPDLDGVLEVQTYGAMLHVFVDDPDRRRPEIETALAAQGITCEGMREIAPRMEEAFISLIRRQEGIRRQADGQGRVEEDIHRAL
jgi:ABC-2 type transport system ATP-binding protein